MSLPTDPIYTADWWRRFFGHEPALQLEFVQEAVERGLGLVPRWSDETWGDIREASDNGSRHTIPQPFDVRHMMGLMSCYMIFAEEEGVALLVDILGRHDELRFAIEGLGENEVRQLARHAEQRLRLEFPWVWGWRENCWGPKETPSRDIFPQQDPPDQHGRN